MRLLMIILLSLFVSSVIYSQEVTIPGSSSEKYNKRGFYKNGDAVLKGNEIIGDYDGNLMLNYSTPVELDGGLGGDFTITYNANVDHRTFGLHNDNRQGNMINTPEWILGYRGFAVQTLNFETNYLVKHQSPQTTNPTYSGEEVPLLIPGYHYGNNLSLSDHDVITLLRADGSKLILVNTTSQTDTGLYNEVGKGSIGFAIVAHYQNVHSPYGYYRRLWYKPGDGSTYVFEERKVEYKGYEESYTNAPMVFYLKEIHTESYTQEHTNTYGSASSTASLTGSLSSLSSLALQNSSTAAYSLVSASSIGGGGRYNNPNKRWMPPGTVDTAMSYGVRIVLDYDTLFSSLYPYPPGGQGGKDITYGRWVFRGLRMDIGKEIENPEALYNYELNVEYGYDNSPSSPNYGNLYNVVINNSSQNDKLILNVAPRQSSSGVVSELVTTDRDPLKSRILMLSSIKDKLNRVNTFSYTEQNRTYTYPSPLNIFLDLTFKLPSQIDYYTGQTTKFLFFGKTFSGSGNPVFSFDGAYPNIQVNMDKACRDCFTNFMIKYREIYNRFGSNSTLFKKEVYEYNVLKSFSLSAMRIDSIETRISEYEGGGSIIDGDPVLSKPALSEGAPYVTNSVNSSNSFNTANNVRSLERLVKTTVKLYTTYKTDFFDLSSYDRTKTIKLVSERIQNESGSQYVEKNSIYDFGEAYINPTNWVASYYKGTFDLRRIVEKKKDSGEPVIRITNISNTYEPADSSTISYAGKYSITKTLKKTEKVQDSLYYFNSLSPMIKETRFLNLMPKISFESYSKKEFGEGVEQDNDEYYYKTGLASTEKVYGWGITKSSKHSEYFERGQFAGKVKRLINNYGTGLETYVSFTYDDKISGAPKSIENDKGARQEYHYPIMEGLNPDRTEGIIVKCDGTKAHSYFIHQNAYYFLKPFKTMTIYPHSTNGKDTLINYSSYMPGGNLDFEVDVNGYHSAFAYDSVGRLIAVALPGSFIDNTTPFVDTRITTPGLRIEKQPDTTGSIRYKYNDQANTVEEWRRINPDANNRKELYTINELDALGQIRRTSVENDAGHLECKTESIFNSQGKVAWEKVYTGETAGRTKNYTYDFLGRLTRLGFDDGNSQEYEYQWGEFYPKPGIRTHELVRFSDEAGKVKESYYDIEGKLIAEKLGANSPIIYSYNSLNQLESLITPEGKTETYLYDKLGRLMEKNTPDAGRAQYSYDKYGNLRFSYNPSGNNDRVIFTQYDALNRIVSTGEIPVSSQVSFASDGKVTMGSIMLDPNQIDTSIENESKFVLVNMYDKYTPSGVFSLAEFPYSSGLENLKGRLVATAYKDKPADSKWKFKFYTYDCLGRVTNTYSCIQ